MIVSTSADNMDKAALFNSGRMYSGCPEREWRNCYNWMPSRYSHRFIPLSSRYKYIILSTMDEGSM